MRVPKWAAPIKRHRPAAAMPGRTLKWKATAGAGHIVSCVTPRHQGYSNTHVVLVLDHGGGEAEPA